MKFIRNILISILLVIITSIAVLWAVTYFVQPATFKLIAKKQLSSLTHQDSAIEGNINWRIFPRPGLHLTKVRIGDVNKTDGDYALLVDNLTFHVQFMPLLQGQLVFDKLILNGFTLRINLDKKASGTPTPTQKKQVSPKKISTALPTHVALKSLLLTNGQILFVQKNEQMLLKNVRLEAELPKTNHEQFPIQLKANIQKKSDALSLSGTLNYKGLLKLPPLNTTNTQLENLELDGQTAFQNIHLNDYDITEANAHTFYRNGKLILNPLTLSLYNGESVGQLIYQLKTSALSFNQNGTGLNAEPVFQHVLDMRPSHLTGTLDFSITAAAQLNLVDWHKKIQANGNFTMHNGTLAYINLPAITAEATKTIKTLASQNIENIQQALSHFKPWRLNDYSGNTAFELFNFQYQLNGDNTLIYNLLLETKKLNLKGQGHLNLETEAIQAHLTAYIITNDKTTQAIQLLLGHGFPLLVTGTLSHPLINADTHILKSIISSDALPKALIKPLNKLKSHINKKLNAE
ncbi:MAG: AsmA family protein [Legionella sp.]|nr:AsmA family protein [Legionella sp.]